MKNLGVFLCSKAILNIGAADALSWVGKENHNKPRNLSCDASPMMDSNIRFQIVMKLEIKTLIQRKYFPLDFQSLISNTKFNKIGDRIKLHIDSKSETFYKGIRTSFSTYYLNAFFKQITHTRRKFIVKLSILRNK